MDECTAKEFADAYRTILADDATSPPAAFDGVMFERRFGLLHLDRRASRLLFAGRQAAALILVGRRGHSCHLSALGVAEAYRRRGIARQLVTELCDEARQRGDLRVVVEVTVENAAAINLYRESGFKVRRRLLGFQHPAFASEGPPEPIETVDTFTVAELLSAETLPELSWFLHPATLFGYTLPMQGYCLDHHAYAVAKTSGSELRLQMLYVRPHVRRLGAGTKLLEAIAQREGTTSCKVVPFVPDGLCNDFFAALGFEEFLPHHEMELTLSSST